MNNPTKVAGRLYVYLAQDARPGGHVHFDDAEEIEVVAKSYDDIIAMMLSGEVVVSGSIAALFLYHLRTKTDRR